jgi:hypothetical protein
VGAFVRDLDRRQFVTATRKLSPACLGGDRPAALLDLLLRRAQSLQAGPQAELQRALAQNIEVGQGVVLPHPVADLPTWVRDFVLPTGAS